MSSQDTTPSSDRPVALVTGVSRRSGIAASVAVQLAADGWDLALCGWRPYDSRMRWGRHDTDLDEIVMATTRLGARTHYIEVDLSDPDTPRLAFDEAEKNLGTPRALAAVHTHDTGGGVSDLDVSDFDHHMAVNARGTFLLIKEFSRRFRGPHGSGRIVTFVSGLPLAGSIAYAASKGAIHWMSVSAAAELAPKGITVNTVNPGPTDTGWMGQEIKERIRAEAPLGRIGQPRDAAHLVTWLCSEEGGWMTGQMLTSDGGWSTIRW